MNFRETTMDNAVKFAQNTLVNVPVRIIFQANDSDLEMQTKTKISRMFEAGSELEIHDINKMEMYVKIKDVIKCLINEELFEFQMLLNSVRIIIKSA